MTDTKPDTGAMLDLEELERLLVEATPGPLCVTYRFRGNQNPGIESASVEDAEGHAVATLFITAWRKGMRDARPDAQLVVALRNAAPALIRMAREAETLRAERDELRADLHKTLANLGYVEDEHRRLRGIEVAARAYCRLAPPNGHVDGPRLLEELRAALAKLDAVTK